MEIDPVSGDIFVAGLAAVRTLQYTKYAQNDHWGSDITCDDHINSADCQPTCNSLPRCIAYNMEGLNPSDVRCCFKFSGTPYTFFSSIDIYLGQVRNYAFTARLQVSTKTVLYTTVINGTNSETIMSIAVDSNNSAVYIAGMTNSPVFNGESNGDGSFEQQFLSKLSMSDGSVQWTRLFGGSGDGDTALGLAIHPISRAVYVGGRVAGAIQQTPPATYYGGAYDISLAKFTTDGNQVWLINAGTNGTDIGQVMTISDRGKLFIAGQINGTSGLFLYDKDYIPPVITSTSTPTTTTVLKDAPTEAPLIPRNDGSRNVVADAVGGTIGGLALLMALIAGILFFMNRRRRKSETPSAAVETSNENKV
jgi:hypothetical protein